MSSADRMVSSLPIMHESDLDIEQTKLALDILRKISVSMLNNGNNSSSAISSSNSSSSSNNNNNNKDTMNNKYRNNFFKNVLLQQNSANITDRNNKSSTSGSDIIVVDQINNARLTSAGLPDNNRGDDGCQNEKNENHEEMLTASDDETYCPQYYNQKHQHHHSHRHLQHHHHRPSLSSNSIPSAQQLLYRSVSSPISGQSGGSPGDSILAYLTAEEGHSSPSSSNSSSTTALTSDDENHRQKCGCNRRGRTMSRLFYDSTASSSGSLNSVSSVKSHNIQPHHQQQENNNATNVSPGLNEEDSKFNDIDDDCFKLKSNQILNDKVEQKEEEDDDLFDLKNKEIINSPSATSTNSTSSFYYSCTVDHQEDHNKGTSPQQRYRHESEGEIKCLRDQLEIEKLSFQPDEQQHMLNPLSSISSFNEVNLSSSLEHEEVKNKYDNNEDADDDKLIEIPEIHLQSLQEFQELFLGRFFNETTPNNSNNERKSQQNIIRVNHLQNLFDCFKISQLQFKFGKDLLFALQSTQERDDFQWVLHQMGGFHALLMLYARVVEISSSDWLQSQALNLVLNQLKNHAKLTDPPLPKQYHLLRYVLNSENSTFQYQTYKVLMSHCLNPCGQRIQDYSLFLICIMESWRILIRTKCIIPKEDEEEDVNYDPPSILEQQQNFYGSSSSSSTTKIPVTLLEHFLITMNSLCNETNSQRDINIGILKENGFAVSLLTLCKGVVYIVTEEKDTYQTCNEIDCSHLTIDDGLKIAKLVRSLLNELMAPPDGNIASTLIQYGLLPLLPKELPPLPIKENSFFVYPKYDEDSDLELFTTSSSSSSASSSRSSLTTTNDDYTRFDVSYADEAKEFYNEDDGLSSDEDNNSRGPEKTSSNLEVPTIIVQNLAAANEKERRSSALSMNLVNSSSANEFLTIFTETLVEGFMSILLNSLAILPDSIFHAILNQQHVLSYHILLAYCSHSNVTIKALALKLISTYLSRVKTNILTEFLKNRGFFLAALYIQGCNKIAPLVSNICHGFGPVSYSMMVGLIYSPTIVGKLIDWITEDPTCAAPALLSVGIFPSIIYYYKTATKFSNPLNRLLALITKYVVLNPKNEPWSILFCPGIESSTKSSLLCSKLLRDAIEILRNAGNLQLKKSEASTRFHWLIENSINGRYGVAFEKWLFKLLLNQLNSTSSTSSSSSTTNGYNNHISDEYNEAWKYFVKKNTKKMHYFMGLFLCNVFAPNRTDNNNIYYNFQQYVIRELLASVSITNFSTTSNNTGNNNTSTNTNWLLKVLTSDEQITHCFKIFIQIYFMENESNPKLYMRHQSFQSLSPLLNNKTSAEQHHHHQQSSPTTELHEKQRERIRHRRSSESMYATCRSTIPTDYEALNTIFHLSDRSVNLKFQTLLISLGIIQSTNNGFNRHNEHNNLTIPSSKFITNFKSLNNMFMDNPIQRPPVGGGGGIENYYGTGTIPYHELRKCLVTIEKLRLQQQRKAIKSSVISSTFKRHNNIEDRNRIGENSRRRGSLLFGSSSAETTTPVPFHLSNSKSYFDSVFETVSNCALDVIDVCTKLRARQEIEIARRLSIREVDIIARQKWWDIRQNMTHPKAPWYFPEIYPSFWALDQSEGPGRIRIRLRKEPLRVANKFIMPEFRKQEIRVHPFQYLFYSSSEEYMGYAGVQSDIKFIRSCLRIVPGEELTGELIITNTSLHFIPEICNRFNWDRIDVMKTSIYQILRRRYALEDRGLELFVGSRCFLFVFKTQFDREQFIQILVPQKTSLTSIALNNSHHLYSLMSSSSTNLNCSMITTTISNSELLNATLTTMTTQWIKGNLSNFDYLMHLNTAAGRTNCDLMQYPVFPFVLCKYSGSSLDLNSPASFRDLRKPMAIQDPSREEHFISTYNYLKREGDSAPFHYGSHYSNSGIVLHFLVRLPPYTQHFLKYQDGNFDIPDRSFHSIETAWRLASRDSNTDFKEMIPEFFYLPEFLQNLQHFDLGVRQNGTRVDDVVIPEWANGNARLFTLINRQALESAQVRKYMSDWIDLIFGYKQTGTFAIQALNVFHPSTYEGFEVDGDADELIRRARKAMVSTYGQTPKKLFGFPHPRVQPIQNHEDENKILPVLQNITGLKWGRFLGSPASPGYEVISSRDFHNESNIELFETISRVVFWPAKTLILADAVVGSWDASGIRVKSNILYLCIADEITTVCGVDTTIWIGHESGKITVLKLSPNLSKVLESVDLIGHYKAIKCIDLNNEFSTAFSCSGENYTIAWDMNTITFCNVIANSEPIDFIYSSRFTGDVLLLNYESNTVKFTTINGFEIGKIENHEKIASVCISNLDPGRNVNIIAIGCDYGTVRFYSSWDLKFLSQIKVNLLSTLPIKSIRYSKDGRRLYCLSQTETSSMTVALQMTPPSRKGSS